MNYSNSNIRIVLFGIRSVYFGIWYTIISQKTNIFGIPSILNIQKSTDSHLEVELVTLLGPDLVTGRGHAPALGVAGEAQARHPAPALAV